MRMKLFAASLAGLMVLAVGSVRASDPIGVYALISKVELHRNHTGAEAVLIDGAFSFAVPRPAVKPAGGFGDERFGDIYGPVQLGYLYYACPKGSDARCMNEWADLKAVAGNAEVVGFGARRGNNGTVRVQTQELRKLMTPDPYPINIGVVKVGHYRNIFGGDYPTYPDLVAALDAALAKK